MRKMEDSSPRRAFLGYLDIIYEDKHKRDKHLFGLG